MLLYGCLNDRFGKTIFINLNGYTIASFDLECGFYRYRSLKNDCPTFFTDFDGITDDFGVALAYLLI